jgi:hypothetical protein
VNDRSLQALGLADVALLEPLAYPGRPVTEPGLLLDDEYLALRVASGPLGRWPAGDNTQRSLDAVLHDADQPAVADRVAVIAVGSNASPGQVRHKFVRRGLPVAVPMVPVRITGIGVGASAHISPAGYVAAAPYADRDAITTLVVDWLDAAQLTAMDTTEFPDYRRIVLPGGEFPMVLPSGERLADAHLYVSTHGVLAPAGGAARPGDEQRTLLRDLLSASRRLRDLLGPDAHAWIAKASADRAARAAGTRIFAEEGWALLQDELLARPAAEGYR